LRRQILKLHDIIDVLIIYDPAQVNEVNLRAFIWQYLGNSDTSLAQVNWRLEDVHGQGYFDLKNDGAKTAMSYLRRAGCKSY
jgi:hypothetical protein